MAIVKMQKLDLLAARSQKEELLRELMRLGCVELREQEELLEAENAPALTRESGDAAEWRAKRNALADAIRLLDRYAPKKTPLLAPKPEVAEAEFLDESEMEQAVATAKEIVALDEKLRNCQTEEARQTVLIESLKPWRGFDLPLETNGTRQVAMTLGTVPAAVDTGALSAALTAAVEETQVNEITSDENLHYLSVFYLRESEEKVTPVLREYGFAAPAFGSVTGTAEENIRACESAKNSLEKEKTDCESKLTGLGQWRDKLRLCYDRAGTYVDRAEASELLLGTGTAVSLSGWVSAPEAGALKALLDKYDCAYELSDPVEEEYGDVPVKLKNNKLTDGLNMVTDMYSLPRYGTVDPNPLMAPFFIIFYGIMMADMGYGLLMMLAGLIIMKVKRPKKGFMKYFGELMIEGGFTTFVFGVLTAGFFGDAAKQIALMFNPDSTFTWFWPALFDPLNDTIYVLVGAMILGFIHLNVGMVISFVQKVKQGQTLDAVLYEGSLWVIFIGAAVMFLAKSPIVLIVGVVALFAGAMRGKKGIGMFTAIFSTLYNELTGWFGDLLSYSRLMALMLAGSVIAQVFNTLGALPGNIIVFALIFLAGHTLNFGLNLLGCYVHDLRLQCLEYFGKFYVDGGKPFRPLAMNTKYVDVVKE